MAAMRRNTGFISQCVANQTLIQILRFGWVTLIIWCEFGEFFWSVSDCRWPDESLGKKPASTSTEQPTHVLIVADPQILDSHSYAGRNLWLKRVTQFIVDLYLRKSWTVALRLKPHVVLFLGDMMDNGRYAFSQAEYDSYFDRFKSIFKASPSTEVLYMPGNHDVGLGKASLFSPHARHRYVTSFGPTNQRVSVSGHTLLLIDAPGLVEEDYLRSKKNVDFDVWSAPPRGTVDFVQKFSAEKLEEPVILFSHIPLFRPDTASCGPLREHGNIRRGVGYGYQNTLGKQTTQFLLQKTSPVMVFSGDDHDYCEYVHTFVLPNPTSESRHTKEISVKSFSMAMGIRRPGFQLLSLVPPSSDFETSFVDRPCLLPDQVDIYTKEYVPFLVITVIMLLISNLRRARWKDSYHANSRVPPTPGLGRHPATLAAFLPPESMLWSASPSSTPTPTSSSQPSSPQSLSFDTRHLRTPSRTTSVHRTLRVSRATTPVDSPTSLSRVPSMSYFSAQEDNGDEDDDDVLSPIQFARRANQEEESVNINPYFFPPPPGKNSSIKKSWSWSHSFVFRGRRRRVRLSMPTSVPIILTNLRAVVSDFEKFQALVMTLLADIFTVAWPPILLFILIALWMFHY